MVQKRLQLSQSSEESPPKVKMMKKAILISSSYESILEAGERLRAGNLVSFPTETVYGLGCNGLNKDAINKVFQAKERPLTDPLILHVTDPKDALDLWEASSSSNIDQDTKESSKSQTLSLSIERQILQALTSDFWPGPLTVVAKASKEIPSIVMANTGYVAFRSPSHEIARSLIKASGVPLAAPSANKFGHVSPTKAQHVFDDLHAEDVWIIDPSLSSSDEAGGSDDIEQSNPLSDSVVCDVGVESTVAKVEMVAPTSWKVEILRHGAISQQDISTCLKERNIFPKTDDSAYEIQVVSKHQSTNESVSHVAPGQTIKHYSPNVPSFMISSSKQSKSLHAEVTAEERSVLESSVIIDFGARLVKYQQHALDYRDLSAEGDSKVAASKIFDTLRWSETVHGAERVYIPEINVDNMDKEDIDNQALLLAVKDKLTRAASGVVIETFI